MSDHLNIAVIRGVVTGEPVQRTLPSGGVVVQFDLTMRSSGGSCSAPVAWTDPPARARRELYPGAELVVTGAVRRRFFRVDGVTRGRTEVVATGVVPTRRRVAASRLVARSVAQLSEVSG